MKARFLILLTAITISTYSKAQSNNSDPSFGIQYEYISSNTLFDLHTDFLRGEEDHEFSFSTVGITSQFTVFNSKLVSRASLGFAFGGTEYTEHYQGSQTDVEESTSIIFRSTFIGYSLGYPISFGNLQIIPEFELKYYLFPKKTSESTITEGSMVTTTTNEETKPMRPITRGAIRVNYDVRVSRSNFITPFVAAGYDVNILALSTEGMGTSPSFQVGVLFKM